MNAKPEKPGDTPDHEAAREIAEFFLSPFDPADRTRSQFEIQNFARSHLALVDENRRLREALVALVEWCEEGIPEPTHSGGCSPPATDCAGECVDMHEFNKDMQAAHALTDPATGEAEDTPPGGRCPHCTYAGADLYQVCGRPDCLNAIPPEDLDGD